jgi:hypothetical protein
LEGRRERPDCLLGMLQDEAAWEKERKTALAQIQNALKSGLSELMTGVDDRERDFSMPPGQCAPNCLRCRTRSQRKFSVLNSLSCRRCRVHPSPARTAKAGANALTLGRALQYYPNDWLLRSRSGSPISFRWGSRLQRAGKSLGNRSQFS